MTFFSETKDKYKQVKYNLELLNEAHVHASKVAGVKGGTLQVLFSKNAVIELNSFIEEIQDEILYRAINSRIPATLPESYLRRVVENHIFTSKMDFEIEKSFMGVLLKILGAKKISNIISKPDYILLKGTVNNLLAMRNTHSHTTTPGTAPPTVYSPSRCLSMLDKIYSDFRVFQDEIS